MNIVASYYDQRTGGFKSMQISETDLTVTLLNEADSLSVFIDTEQEADTVLEQFSEVKHMIDTSSEIHDWKGTPSKSKTRNGNWSVNLQKRLANGFSFSALKTLIANSSQS
jgi:hypothetical protein